jgi:hydrogenase maturation protease
MNSIRIIGVGSPKASESVGLLAVDQLKQMDLHQNYPDHQISLEKLDHPGPALLECVQGADLAIIIDALLSDHVPGEVVRLRPDDIVKEEWALSGNELGVAETIALGNVLGELPERLLILGVVALQSAGLTADNSEIDSNIMDKIRNTITEEIG